METTFQPVHAEPWRSKRWIADSYGYSTRWVERQVARGMPSRMIGGQRRFQLSPVEDWQQTQTEAAD